MTNLLKNGDFEGINRPGEWTRKTHNGTEYGEIFTPAEWTTFFFEAPDSGIYRPEVHVIQALPPYLDPPRILHGSWAIKMFKSFGRIRGGFYQVVTGLETDALYQFRFYAHAWSNHPGTGPCSNGDDPKCSAGVGSGPAWIADADLPPLTGDPANDAIPNFLFWSEVSFGPDPRPWAENIKGGMASIYNAYGQVPVLEFRAPAPGTVVVYIRVGSLWPFKHSDAYFDRAVLERIADPIPPPVTDRGKPRVQYEREVILINPEKRNKEWFKAAIDATFDQARTVLASADDAGIGDLDHRGVTAVNPGDWSSVNDPGDLAGFFTKFYPGVIYRTLQAVGPEDLYQQLAGGDPEPPPDPVLPEPGHVLGLHLQTTVPGWDVYVRTVKPGAVKMVEGFELAREVKALSPNTLTVVRHHVAHQGAFLEAQDKRAAARDFIAQWADSLHNLADVIDVALGLNEYIGTGDYDGIMRGVEWSVAFADELYAEFGDAIVPGLGNVAVGNPQHGDEERLMFPMARAAIRRKGYMVYHSYWPPHKLHNVPGATQYWYHYAGRALTSWDVRFAEAGLAPMYLFGELGVVGEHGDNVLEPNAGWLDPLGYNGDWRRYEKDLLDFQTLVQDWNKTHGNRARGGFIFTTGIGVGWETFQMRTGPLQWLQSAINA